MTLNVLIGNGSWYPVAAGPVLVTAPVVKVYRGTANAVGTIYTFDRAVWQNESGLQYTGTIQSGDLIAANQLYIGASPIEPVNGERWYVSQSVGDPYNDGAGQYSEITSYNASTKVATINWPTALRNPPVGRTWYLIRGYPLVRSFQWQRNGVDIPGQIDVTYTAVAADLGATLTIKEQAGRISAENNGSTLETPTLSTATSAGYSINIAGTDYSSAADFTYLGAFRSNSAYGVAFSGSISLVEAADAFNGQKSLIAKGGTGSGAIEFAIPATLSMSTDENALPEAVITSPNGGFYPLVGSQSGGASGLATSGIGYNYWGLTQISGTSTLITNEIGAYSIQQLGLFWRRPADISVDTPEGPFVPVDSAAGQLNSRWQGGSIVNIPSEWQSAFGGDLLLSSGPASVHSNNSQGPGCMVISNAAITAALPKRLDGTARAGTANTMQLATDASGVADYYVGCYVYCPSFNEPDDEKSVYRITAYNNSTKTITVSSNFRYVPTSSTTYKIYPNVEGKQLSGYSESAPLADADANGFTPEWSKINSDTGTMFFPRNSGLVIFATSAIIGYGDYGIKGAPSGSYKNKLIYDPYDSNTSPANRIVGYYKLPSNNKATARIMVYAAADLASVAAGSIAYDAVKPKAIYALPFSFGNRVVRCFAFDNSNGKLYVSQNGQGKEIYQVYSFAKWS